jgi:hypothetical protein
MTDRAVAVYRNMLRVEPGNVAVRRRLAEIEGREDAAEVVVAARAAAPAVPAPPVPKTVAVVAAPAPAAPEPPPAMRSLAPADRAAVERLERWLAAIRSAPGAGFGADA